MRNAEIASFIQHIRGSVRGEEEPAASDGGLLTSLVDGGDEDAFASLLERHGRMVFGVCRRILANQHDAEDAFQATFLVLIQQAGELKNRQTIGNWLYGVACKTALKARALRERRREKEQVMARRCTADVAEQVMWRELSPLLDEELRRLPDKYREPIVLCDIEGVGRREAASQLGWPEGTVAGRLVRGRVLLANRLKRRGVTLAGGSLATLMANHAASAACRAPLVQSTVASLNAPATAGEQAAALATSVVHDMRIGRLSLRLAVLALFLAGVALIAGFTYAGGERKRLLNAPTGKVVRPLPPQQQPVGKKLIHVWSVAFRPDGKQIASAGQDGAVRLWDLDGKIVRIMKGHQRKATSVAWSRDGKRLVSASYDGTVRIWNADGTAGPVLRGHNGVVASAAWSPDGKLIASAGFGDNTVRLWRANGTEVVVLKAHSQQVRSVTWHPKANLLASGSYDGTVRVWRADGKPYGPGMLKAGGGHVYAVSWGQEGVLLAAACHNGTVGLWDMAFSEIVKGGAPSMRIKAHIGQAFALGWSRDGKKLASGGADKLIRIWDARGSFKRMLVLKGHDVPPQPENQYSQYVHSVSWSPDQKTIVSGGMDGTIRLWDATTGKAIWVRDSTPPKIAAVNPKIHNAIDDFIHARIKANKLEFAPEASRHVLARRAAMSLIGLPLTVGQLKRFLADKRPGAYERLVDRLLQSKAHKEYWAVVAKHYKRPADRQSRVNAEKWARVMWRQTFGPKLSAAVHPLLKERLTKMVQSKSDAEILRQLTTSATFRRSFGITPKRIKDDPDNKWLARFPVTRLSDWVVCRSLLFLCDLPNDKGQIFPHKQLKPQPKRKPVFPPPAAITLTGQEGLQKSIVGIARRVLLEGGQSDDERIRYAFLLVLGREPMKREHEAMTKQMRDMRKRNANNPQQAPRFRKLNLPVPGNPLDAMIWTDMAWVLVNTNEFAYKR